MNCYEGAIKGVDEPKGFFGYTLKKPMNDHCQFNFKKFAGRVYGHVPGSTNPNLTRLGGSRSDDSVNGVTVVWIATHPDSGGRVIVGWYKNATVWRRRQSPKGELARQRTIRESGDCCEFSVEAHAGKTAKCLLRGKRPPLNTDKGRPGQNPFWYGSPSANTRVLRLTSKGSPGVRQQWAAKNARGGWIQDLNERLKIEANAMDVVERYFGENGYRVDRRDHENVGYDMLATSAAAELLLEVKGNKGEAVCVELTPNEFSCAKKKSSTFRLCVVVNALDKKRLRRLRIFKPGKNGTEWTDESGIRIRTLEKTGAVVRE